VARAIVFGSTGARAVRVAPARRGAAPAPSAGSVGGGVRTLLRLEGLAVLAVAIAAYAQFGAGWGWFALLFLLPDLSFLAYLAGPRAGAAAYNAAHSYAGPLALLAIGVLGAVPALLAVALVWGAHIGFDRALGYGLKYASGFAQTHLGPIGRADPW
jgi:hypothetical protein